MIRLMNGFLRAFCAVAFAAVFSIWLRRHKTHYKRHPPGPWTRNIPFIGSAIEFDFGSPYLTYTKWAKAYGGWAPQKYRFIFTCANR